MPYNWGAHKQLILEESNASWPDLKGNLVFMDIVINGNTEKTMRLVFALFMDECPLAASNFHAFCTHNRLHPISFGIALARKVDAELEARTSKRTHTEALLGHCTVFQRYLQRVGPTRGVFRYLPNRACRRVRAHSMNEHQWHHQYLEYLTW